MKTIVFLFGEMGGGKTYHGQRLAAMTQFTFFEGDSIVPPAMAEKVQNFKPLPREMIREYVTLLANKVADLAMQDDVKGLLVSQALYLNEDRKFLDFFLRCLGYNVKWYWVKTPFWRNLKQILTRKNGWRWAIYWLMNKPFFQKPTHPYVVL